LIFLFATYKEVPYKMYRIAWTYKYTNFSGYGGHGGHGEYCFTYDNAKEYIRDLNERYPDMNHWIESESESDCENENPTVIDLTDD
jgi:hypothetical protein